MGNSMIANSLYILLVITIQRIDTVENVTMCGDKVKKLSWVTSHCEGEIIFFRVWDHALVITEIVPWVNS